MTRAAAPPPAAAPAAAADADPRRADPHESAGGGDRRRTIVVVLALLGNLAIAVSKGVAAALTGSSAMASEAVHSLIDTTNEVLLLYGLHRSHVPPDRRHPFGHDREVYFWSFIVALLIFALGAGVSAYEGVSRLRDPRPLHAFGVSLAVLGVAFVFEGISWIASLRELRRSRGEDGLIAAVRRSKDPSTFTVFLEDSAALIGIGLAAAGLLAARLSGRAEFDALASIAIALLLGATSFFLARETKGLLIGEQADPRVHESLLRIAATDPAIAHANGIVTVQLGPERVLAALSAEFRDELAAPQIEACVTRLERAFADAHPEVSVLFVKPQASEVWARRRGALHGPPPE
ncbi:MAG TPA: cation diffusion facilitator family transporter [Dokdonella sp.]